MMPHSAFDHRRRRRSGFWRTIQFLAGALLVLAVVGSAYRVGLSASQTRAGKLEDELLRLRKTGLELRDRMAQAERRAREAEAGLVTLQARYANDVPDGALADLLDQVEAQLGAGAEARRLALLIRAASSTTVCEGEPVTKRFVPQTPISTGAASAIRFDERVVVTGAGAAARDPQDLALAWYDPALPVQIDFRTLAGEIASVSGLLPLRHEMIAGGREYRFSIIPGERSFVEVTGQACALPEPETAGEEPPLPG